LDPEPAVAHRTAEGAGADRAAVHQVGQQHQEGFVVVDRTAQVVGQLDEHQGLNTTQVSLPASTVTLRYTFLPPISVPRTYSATGTSLTAKCSLYRGWPCALSP